MVKKKHKHKKAIDKRKILPLNFKAKRQKLFRNKKRPNKNIKNSILKGTIQKNKWQYN